VVSGGDLHRFELGRHVLQAKRETDIRGERRGFINQPVKKGPRLDLKGFAQQTLPKIQTICHAH
jgi:hypothetical protein